MVVGSIFPKHDAGLEISATNGTDESLERLILRISTTSDTDSSTLREVHDVAFVLFRVCLIFLLLVCFVYLLLCALLF